MTPTVSRLVMSRGEVPQVPLILKKPDISTNFAGQSKSRTLSPGTSPASPGTTQTRRSDKSRAKSREGPPFRGDPLYRGTCSHPNKIN